MSTSVLRGAEVRLDRVEKTYGPVVAIAGVSLTVRAGKFLTLPGPSGSGKTTTLACVAGFAIPTEGEVLIQGRPVTFEPPFKRNVGMVFQNYALFPHMTIAENGLPPPHAEGREAASEWSGRWGSSSSRGSAAATAASSPAASSSA